MSLEIFYEKVAKGFLACLVQKFGLNVRLTGQLKEFQRHVLNWRQNLSAYVACVQKQTGARLEKLNKCITKYPRKCDVDFV
jgi:hypothetical protein